MLSVRIFVALFLCGNMSFIISAAQCNNIPIIFNFGDSNSNIGGISVLQGDLLSFPSGRVFFRWPTGRVCDGRLILDFLCESLETDYLNPYFQLFSQGFSNGVNFALSGSSTTSVKIPTSLPSQIKNFVFFRNVSLHNNYFGVDAFASALYMLDIGQNDIVFAFTNTSTLESIRRNVVPKVISNIEAAMQRIYDLGGRNFWVHNTGPHGCLPSQRNTSGGCRSDINAAADEFNAQLQRLCEQLRLKMEGSTIVYVDVHSIKLDIISNYTSYGFQEDPSLPCLRSKRSACPEDSRRVFWDGFHYTETPS